MTQQSTPPLDSQAGEGSIRKRVCKACDRCRLKKSKCDGASPCGRCKADNAICVFGERKKAHDKVYPKGYVEMLEQQQAQLVIGLQELYRRTLEGEGWPGSPLKTSAATGHPLTHDILERLGALKAEGSPNNEPFEFEEDLNLVQQRLLANGAGVMQRQDSSDGSSSNGDGSPTFAAKPMFSADSLITQFPPTPPNYSPYRRPQRIPAQAPPTQSPTQTRSIKKEPLGSSPQQSQLQQPLFPQKQPQLSTVGQTFFPNPPVLQQNNNHNPLLHRQPTWSQIDESMFDDPVDFCLAFDSQSQTHCTQGLENLDYFRAAAQLPRQSLPTGLSSCLGQPDWNDEDFKAFFNPSPSLLS